MLGKSISHFFQNKITGMIAGAIMVTFFSITILFCYLVKEFLLSDGIKRNIK